VVAVSLVSFMFLSSSLNCSLRFLKKYQSELAKVNQSLRAPIFKGAFVFQNV
jgi:hypothetical protein